MNRRQFLKATMGGVALAAVPLPAASFPTTVPAEEVLLDAMCHRGRNVLELTTWGGDLLAAFELPKPVVENGIARFPGPLQLECTESATVCGWRVVNMSEGIEIVSGTFDKLYHLLTGDSFVVTAVKLNETSLYSDDGPDFLLEDDTDEETA